MPVVSRDNAEQVGHIVGYIAVPEQHRLAAIHIGGSKRHPKLIDWASIVSFGDDAVMIGPVDAVREPATEIEQRSASGATPLLDQRVLNTLGDELGTVTNVHFDTGSGVFETIDIGELRLDGDQVLGIGTYAVVVTQPD